MLRPLFHCILDGQRILSFLRVNSLSSSNTLNWDVIETSPVHTLLDDNGVIDLTASIITDRKKINVNYIICNFKVLVTDLVGSAMASLSHLLKTRPYLRVHTGWTCAAMILAIPRVKKSHTTILPSLQPTASNVPRLLKAHVIATLTESKVPSNSYIT